MNTVDRQFRLTLTLIDDFGVNTGRITIDAKFCGDPALSLEEGLAVNFDNATLYKIKTELKIFDLKATPKTGGTE